MPARHKVLGRLQQTRKPDHEQNDSQAMLGVAQAKCAPDQSESKGSHEIGGAARAATEGAQGTGGEPDAPLDAPAQLPKHEEENATLNRNGDNDDKAPTP